MKTLFNADAERRDEEEAPFQYDFARASWRHWTLASIQIIYPEWAKMVDINGYK